MSVAKPAVKKDGSDGTVAVEDMVHNRHFSYSIVSEIGEPSRVPQGFASPAHIPQAAIGLTYSVPGNYARWNGGVFALTAKQLCREGG